MARTVSGWELQSEENGPAIAIDLEHGMDGYGTVYRLSSLVGTALHSWSH